MRPTTEEIREMLVSPANLAWYVGRLCGRVDKLEAALRNFIETVEIVDPGVYSDAILEAQEALGELDADIDR